MEQSILKFMIGPVFHSFPSQFLFKMVSKTLSFDFKRDLFSQLQLSYLVGLLKISPQIVPSKTVEISTATCWIVKSGSNISISLLPYLVSSLIHSGCWVLR